MCVVVEGGSGTDYELAEANKGSDLSRAKQKNAVSMFAVAMSNSKRGKICSLARYSGGSAAAWVVSAWRVVGGEARPIDTEKWIIQGEMLKPAQLIEALHTQVSRGGG